MKKGSYKRLRKIIAELNLTDTQFATGGGISKGTLSGYFNASRLPKVSILANWCSTYKINANWMLLGTSQMFTTQSSASPAATTAHVEAVLDSFYGKLTQQSVVIVLR